MDKEVREILNMRSKLAVLEYARYIGCVTKACQEFEVARSFFYEWKKIYYSEGKSGLRRQKPIAKSLPRKLSVSVVDKILFLRETYHLGPKRINWYLERYHGICISDSNISCTLVRNGVSRLPKTASRRTVHI